MRGRAFEVEGYRGEPVDCVLHEGGSRIAVVFPGAARERHRLGGSPARPDLHYTREVLQAEGLAVLEVWWDAGTVRGEVDAWLDGNVAAALAEAARGHEPALLVGRSFGTLALARNWRAHPLPAILIAPLLDHPPVVDALRAPQAPAFVVGGSADAVFDVDTAEEAREHGVDVLVLEGANHGLQVADPAESARLLAEVVERMRDFVRRTLGAEPASA